MPGQLKECNNKRQIREKNSPKRERKRREQEVPNSREKFSQKRAKKENQQK